MHWAMFQVGRQLYWNEYPATRKSCNTVALGKKIQLQTIHWLEESWVRRARGGVGEITGDNDKENFLENTQKKIRLFLQMLSKWNYA